jgi:hypothetical protein
MLELANDRKTVPKKIKKYNSDGKIVEDWNP